MTDRDGAPRRLGGEDEAAPRQTQQGAPTGATGRSLETGGESKPSDGFPTVGKDARIGPFADYVQELGEGQHTEAHPQAVLLECFAAFGAVVGRGRFARVGATTHPPTIYGFLIGNTADGAKGEAAAQRKCLFEGAGGYSGARVVSSVGSGQGLIEMLGKPEDAPPDAEGVRLFLSVREMASVVAGIRRDASTLSATLREAWDGDQLDTGTRSTTALTASDYTLGLVAHSTPSEFRSKMMGGDEVTNGLANRFQFCPTRRTRLIPRPRPMAKARLETHTKALADAIFWARSGEGEVHMSPEAEVEWDDLYRELATPRAGPVGSVTARVAPQALRMALLYALSMRSGTIEPKHIRAARAWVLLHIEAARWLFGDRQEDRYAEKVMAALRATSGWMSLTHLGRVVGQRKLDERDRAIDELERLGLIERREVPTKGAPRKEVRCKPQDKQDKQAELAAGTVNPAYSAYSSPPLAVSGAGLSLPPAVRGLASFREGAPLHGFVLEQEGGPPPPELEPVWLDEEAA